MGIWSTKKTDKTIMMTLTSSREINTLADLKQDFGNLIKRMRRTQGYKSLEYIAVAERTPRVGLFHLHGILRCDQWINEDYVRKSWCEIHSADQITCKQIGGEKEDLEKVARYITGHLVKRYGDARLKSRPWISKGWLPEGWKQYQKYLYKLVESNDKTWAECNEMMESYCRKYAEN